MGLLSKKTGGWGDRSGMAQTNISSAHKTMIAVFVAITYPMNELEIKFSVLNETEHTPRLHLDASCLISVEKLVE
jgi:hypothetical protein